jgi:hypothetical protein
VGVVQIFSDYCGLGIGSDNRCILSEILKITFFHLVFYLCDIEKLIGEKWRLSSALPLTPKEKDYAMSGGEIDEKKRKSLMF